MLKNSKFFVIGLATMSLSSLLSCEKELKETKVITENILFVSADKVKLSGRIYELVKEAKDHGFELSSTESFAEASKASLGTKNKLGKFIFEVDSLSPGTNYYYRAYVNEAGEMYYGDVMSFSTSYPEFKSISPLFGNPGDRVTIKGNNIPENTKVFFGDVEAEILESSIGSVLQVRVPRSGNQPITEIRFVFGENTILLNQSFEFVFGVWTKMENFYQPISIYNSVSFVNNNTFYIGFGIKRTPTSINNKLWKFDLTSEQWMDANFPHNGFYSGFSSNLGYFGLGTPNWETSSLNNKVWKLNEGNFIELTAPPFGIYKPVSFSVANTLYVGGGQTFRDVDNYLLYKYDEDNNEWFSITTIPFVINSDYPTFSYQESLYFVLKNGDLWTFNTVSENWSKIGEYPFTVKTGSICQIIGSKVYIGVGTENNSILEYDILNNSWKEKQYFSGDRTFINSGYFANNGKLYCFRINPFESGTPFTEIWKFDPLAF